jgi:hypothetical protein
MIYLVSTVGLGVILKLLLLEEFFAHFDLNSLNQHP